MCLKNIPGLFVHDLSVHIFAKNENVCFEISYGDDLHDPNQCIKRITFNNYIHLHGMFIDDKPEKKALFCDEMFYILCLMSKSVLYF